MFVRVTQSADLTASFKLRKVDLQRQGYCPARCSDPLFIRDEQARTYVPYSLEALMRAGLTPFAVADHD
ncbi:long-chain-acyl-CoA synthetase [compost metagenome]